MSQDFSDFWSNGNQRSSQQSSNRVPQANAFPFQLFPQQSFTTNEWLAEASSPWLPQGIAQGNPRPWSHDAAQAQDNGYANIDYGGSSFNQARSMPARSVCETNYDESVGEGSRPVLTPATSVIGGSSTLAPGLHDGFGAISLDPSHPPLPPGSVTSGGASVAKHVCSDCREAFKTPSELRKHKKRHDKPHKCVHSGCGKGFSSEKDLDRHRSSVHKQYKLLDKVYKCTLCPPRAKSRIWPRADNFRYHLKRAHNFVCKVEELTPFETPVPEDFGTVQRSQPPSLSDDKLHVPTPEISVADHNNVAPHREDTTVPGELPLSPWLDRAATQDETLPSPTIQVPLEEALQGLSTAECGQQTSVCDPVVQPQARPEHINSFGLDADLTTERQGSLTGTDMHSSNCDSGEEEEDEDDDDDDTSAEGSHQTQEASWGRELVTDSQPATDNETVQRLKDATSKPGSNSMEILELLKLIPRELLQRALSSTPTDQPPKKTEKCTLCGKVFSRPCELKKHLKRHERPYGCTHANCNKTFGSKNDWKRHEINQHKPSEKWVCDIGDCDKKCNEEKLFKEHLLEVHNMIESKTCHEKLDSCRKGGHCEESFWCGFCTKTIPRTGTLNCRTLRFDHIDNHLFGKNGLEKKCRDQWIDLDEWNRAASTPEPIQRGGSGDRTQDSAPSQRSRPCETPSSSQKRKLSDTESASPVREYARRDLDTSKRIGVADDDGVVHSRVVVSPQANREQTAGSSAVNTTRRKQNVMWDCCVCAFAEMVYEHTRACVQCGHQYCSTCNVKHGLEREGGAV